jgi:hypothetical protein
MAKTARRVVVAMGLVAVGLAETEPAAFGASAQHAQGITLTVLVDDSASVPANILAQARKDAARVFQNIDVEIVWLEQNSARLEDAAALRSVVVVHLPTREMTDHMHAPDPVLGIAAGTGYVTVFYNRIEDLSPTRDANDIACRLGHVIAHELGHLLLRSRAHSRSGIMQAVLNMQLAARGGLFFTADQGRLIRATLGASDVIEVRKEGLRGERGRHALVRDGLAPQTRSTSHYPTRSDRELRTVRRLRIIVPSPGQQRLVRPSTRENYARLRSA